MKIEKTHLILKPNPKKVLLRNFVPATKKQLANILQRITALSEDEVAIEVEKIYAEFRNRHRNINELFLKRFVQVSEFADGDLKLSKSRQMLIGASLCMEYSVEFAALFNPSMVWHPDQSNLSTGSKRFILSLRATGEGHVSSIVFRTGVLDDNNKVILEEPGSFVSSPERVFNPEYDKDGFKRKIIESGLMSDFVNKMLSKLGDNFSLNELEHVLDTLKDLQGDNEQNRIIADEFLSICRSEYEIIYNSDIPMSEQIIFPRSPAESNGIEDARFVKFKDENGRERYYATYTAYNGIKIQSQLLETQDFLHYKIDKLFGSEVKNKGMALFPRKINGRYATLSRQDNENNYIMFSDDLHFWNSKNLLSKPAFNWEIVQSGNCGSPIETDKGWLVLTHGVGPVRKYSVGAMLLDINDPTKIIGRLKEPLLSADENERDGYVPNVVYTCGSLIYNNELIVPYAMSDYSSSFAKVNLQDLFNELISV